MLRLHSGLIESAQASRWRCCAMHNFIKGMTGIILLLCAASEDRAEVNCVAIAR
jgi:hypothetical protein